MDNFNLKGGVHISTPSPLSETQPEDLACKSGLKETKESKTIIQDSLNDSTDTYHQELTKNLDRSVDFLLNEGMDTSYLTSENTWSPAPLITVASNQTNSSIIRIKNGREITRIASGKMIVNPLGNNPQTTTAENKLLVERSPQRGENKLKVCDVKRSQTFRQTTESFYPEPNPLRKNVIIPSKVLKDLTQRQLNKKITGYDVETSNIRKEIVPCLKRGPSIGSQSPQKRGDNSVRFIDNPQQLSAVSNCEDDNNIDISLAAIKEENSQGMNGSAIEPNDRSVEQSLFQVAARTSQEEPQAPVQINRQESMVIDEEEAKMEEKKKKLEKILTSFSKFKIRRTIFACAGLFTAAFLAEDLVEGETFSHTGIFIVAYVLFLYYLLETSIRFFWRDIIPWKKIENLFDALDVLILLIFFISIDLKLHRFRIVTKYMFLMPLVNVVAYFCKSKAPKALKESQTAIRVLFSLQIILFAGKIDGDLEWPWRAVLSFCWLFFGLIGIYCLVVATTLIIVITLSFFDMNIYQNVKKKTQIIGFLWSTFCSGVGILILIGMIGVTLAYDPEDKNARSTNLLKSSLLALKCLSAFVGFFTIMTYRWLIEFLNKFNIDEPEYKSQLGISSIDTMSRVRKEKRSIYLVRLSSTYFSFLNKSYYVKDKEALHKMKKAIKLAKDKHYKRKLRHSPSNNSSNIKRANTVGIQALKIENKGHDTPGKQGNKPECLGAENPKPTQSTDQMKIRRFSVTLSKNLPEKILRKQSTLSIAADHGKICLSEGDNAYDLPSSPVKNRDNGDKLCYICCDKVANAVMVECGHGGICIDCAVSAIEARGQCMECRKDVQNIIKIYPDPQFKDIIKGYETFTIKPLEHQTSGP